MGRRQLLPALLLGACAFLACPGSDVLQAFAASPRGVGRRGALLSVPGLLLPALKPEGASANSLAVQLFGFSLRAEAATAVAALSSGVPWLAGLVVVIAACITVDKAILEMINGAVIPEGFQNQVRIIGEARKDLEWAVGKVQMKLERLLSTIVQEAFLREPRRIQKAMQELDDIIYEVNNCLRLSKKVEDLGEQFKKDWSKFTEEAKKNKDMITNVATVMVVVAAGSIGFAAQPYGEVVAGGLFFGTGLAGLALYQRYEEHFKEKMNVVKEETDKLQEAAIVRQRLDDLKHYVEDFKGELEGLPEGMDEQAMSDANRSLQQAAQEVKERLSHVVEIM